MTQAVQQQWVEESSQPKQTAKALRFGIFEVDLQCRELRKRGLRLNLQKKPFQILELLLERPGELVSRKEVAGRLWPGVYVNFDRSLNTAMNALRRVLGDSSKSPRYLETRSGLGYRFIAPVERVIGDTLPDPAIKQPPHAIGSIAILPFTSAAGVPLTDRIAEEIEDRVFAELSTIEHLRIAARSPEARRLNARELNVKGVLTGRISHHGTSLNAAVELVDTATGWRLWGDNCMGAADDIDGLGRTVARCVAAQFRQPRDISHDEGHQDYLKGRFFLAKFTEDALRRAAAYFESALAQDPNSALAYSGLADTYTLFAFLEVMPPPAAYARARKYAESAVHLDGKLAEARAALAGVKASFEFDFVAAESEFRLALDANPSYAAAHTSYAAAITSYAAVHTSYAAVHNGYAALLSSLGRFDEARNEVGHALELDPLSLIVNGQAAWNFCMARDYGAALQQAWKALALEPHFAPAQHALGLANLLLGNGEEAVVEFQNACVCSDNHPGALAALAHAYAASGQRDLALTILHQLEEISRRKHVSNYWFGLVFTALGDTSAACERLEQGLKDGDVWMPWLNVDPRFDPLRNAGLRLPRVG
ncbi:MAG: winged helix-turn-helix domain-containing protein [Bryobacteraceae bacterium]|jgi:DNA-binding winged helix-turn-helix (wHTH) protein/tetratricopeptide (TPR) repeat protein